MKRIMITRIPAAVADMVGLVKMKAAMVVGEAPKARMTAVIIPAETKTTISIPTVAWAVKAVAGKEQALAVVVETARKVGETQVAMVETGEWVVRKIMAAAAV